MRTSEFADSITGNIDQFLCLIYALLSLSVIVSLFGIVNTLVLHPRAHARDRHDASNRHSAPLVRRIVRYESVITALIGAVLGLTVGFILGVVTTSHSRTRPPSCRSRCDPDRVRDTRRAGGCAGGDPAARRASRLNVLEALAYE